MNTKKINAIEKYYLLLLIALSALAIGFMLGYLYGGGLSSGNINKEALAAESAMQSIENDIGGDNTIIVDASASLTTPLTSQPSPSPTPTSPTFEETNKFNEIETDNTTANSEAAENITHYIVGVFDGYIAVFYADENFNPTAVKEVTDRPVGVLTGIDYEKLHEGLRVTNTDELFQILQDYAS